MNEQLKVGRKRKYSTEQLIDVIRVYLETNEYITKLTYSSLAKFAKETIGYTNIIYNDFMRNDEVKKIIKEFNSKRKLVPELKSDQSRMLTFISFEVDEFIDMYQKNTKMQRILLHRFNDNYKRAFNEVKICTEELKNMNNEIEKLNNRIDKLNYDNKVLRNDNKKLKTSDVIRKKEDKLDRKIAMYISLLNKGLIVPLKGEELINFINSSIGEKINDLVQVENLKVMKKEIIKLYERNDNDAEKLDGKNLCIEDTVNELLGIFEK